MTEIYVDADACPVREEVYRVAERLGLQVHVVFNGSRPILPPNRANVRLVVVGDAADAADDWIAERITSADICVTADIPLASRCLAKDARARLRPTARSGPRAISARHSRAASCRAICASWAWAAAARRPSANRTAPAF